MIELRYAILAAVSTKAQAAADRISLPDQIRQCRAVAAERGWVESAGPFEIPGASRTKYVNLSDAERAIPPLRKMLDAAQRHEFDVLMLYHLNRLRDLLDPVYRSLGVYKVQIFSVTQPVEPVDPDRYNYETSDTMRIVVTMSQMTSQAETSDIRKRYNAGMPARVIKQGLPANAPPYGYIKGRDRKSPPELDPDLSLIVVEMKDRFLNGEGTTQIARLLDDRKISPPRSDHWYPSTVKGILVNPFYAGYVRWGVSRIERDLRAGTRNRNRKIDKDDISIVKGKHDPLWDDDTYTKIKRKLNNNRKNEKATRKNQFSSLLVCGVCGARLWRQGNGPRDHRLIWRCSKYKYHVNIPHEIAVDVISKKLENDLRSGNQVGSADHAIDGAKVKEELNKYKDQRKRLEDAYQIGAINLEALIERSSSIDSKIKDLKNLDLEIKNARHDKEAWLNTMGGLEKIIDNLGDYIKHEDPPKVNRALKILISYIIIGQEFDVTIVFN